MCPNADQLEGSNMETPTPPPFDNRAGSKLRAVPNTRRTQRFRETTVLKKRRALPHKAVAGATRNDQLWVILNKRALFRVQKPHP